jgi:hypothetical protein
LFAELIDGILLSNSLLIALKENEQRLLKDNLELRKQINNLKESQEKQLNNLKQSQRKLAEETTKNLQSQSDNTNRLVKGLIAREGFYLRQLELTPEQIELLLETFEAEQLADLHQAYFTYSVLREKVPNGFEKSTSEAEMRGLWLQALTDSKTGPIFIIALPKSAGSWLTFSMQEVTGFLKANKRIIKACPPLTHSPWMELYPYFTDLVELQNEAVEYFLEKPAIIHAHIAPTENNIKMITNSDMKCVLLYRDLRDVIISLYYHILQRKDGNQAMLEGVSNEEGLEIIIEQFLPGLVAFVMGWFDYRDNPNFLFIRYEELITRSEDTFRRILQHYGLTHDENRIGSVLERYKFKSEKGEANLIHSTFKWRSGKQGEWKSHFSEKNKKSVKDLTGDILVDLGYELNTDW